MVAITERSSNLFWTKNAWIASLRVSARRTSASKAKQFSFNFLSPARQIFLKRNWKLFCFDVLIPRRRKRFATPILFFGRGGMGVWGEFRPALSFPLSLFSLALEVVPTSLARRPICFYFTCFIGILESLRNLVKVLFSVPLLLPECRCCPVLLLQ